MRFGLSVAARIRLGAFDVMGRNVGVLAQGDYPAGVHELRWNGPDGRGSFFLVLEAGASGRLVRTVKRM